MVLVILGVILGTPALGGVVYLHKVGYLGESDPGATIEVVIPEGMGMAQIGKLLERKGVIKSFSGWRIATYFDDDSRTIQAGRYELPTGLTAGDALQALLGGPLLDFVMVTFPEGAWLEDFARVLGSETHITAKEFRRVAVPGSLDSDIFSSDIPSVEGLLFPSTYQIVEDDTAETVFERLTSEFERQLAKVDLDDIGTLGYSPYEVVIVASMIEAEAAVDADRGKIARVIYNRLAEGIALGIDATVLYALGEHKSELTVSDLAVDSPYNTREVAGLPPTPIGAPGLESLRAAAAPEPGDWLYYVLADCEGHHAFSESYDQFLTDKAAYNRLTCG